MGSLNVDQIQRGISMIHPVNNVRNGAVAGAMSASAIIDAVLFSNGLYTVLRLEDEELCFFRKRKR
ncbi:uncharacterized protein N7477_006684 [Penicillium maclennaniae]|uniref:uncharacterized protein n=1 Tax=Penicillium maclennaniae TaxID=1343394 RepID=UPI0025418B6A|nr:uncharacterized protein N7477_006684 [Penicillium maclennaniae]KAJ5668114.1 hypothetical protein N7477_006684 [Penicillium maclennaniae]